MSRKNETEKSPKELLYEIEANLRSCDNGIYREYAHEKYNAIIACIRELESFTYKTNMTQVKNVKADLIYLKSLMDDLFGRSKKRSGLNPDMLPVHIEKTLNDLKGRGGFGIEDHW
jgi:hypothetical protein